MNRFKISYQENNKIKSVELSKEEFEKNELPKNIISIKKSGKSFLQKRSKIKDKDIKNCLYELSLMLNSDILINEALDILIKKEKKQELKSFLIDLKKSFSSSSNLSKSLKKYKINPLIKSLFEITQKSGNSSSNIEFLSNIISENYEIKKEFLKTMLYPIILTITFFLSLFAIFKFVVPSFESILKNSNAELSIATKVLFLCKDFFENYTLLFLISLILLYTFFLTLYKKELRFKIKIDKLLVRHLFLLSHLYRLKSLYIFFVVFEILLKNRFEFLDSLKQAKILLKNQYLLDRITQIEYLLKNGKSVKFAFESSNLFDDVTLSLINTGEVTNSLPKVVYEIKNIYKKRFDDSLKIFSTLIEPLFFIIIMALVLWIVFAIFVPLWGLNDMLKV
ncbi:type II secretion system F family protein [Halarcobacter anaerophilus]|uniref:Transformation system protein n=2 Tax=Halarcobacter anaerophilus TaxID=877500 RepID=A0A4Q0XZV6_9BACT|nr:type II secretion system F family protein [Halarcobacter anaerophilus]QDF29785.1 type II secretion/transformation system, F protein [Halarcobacter anaerophilus]RXJ62705.1 transformation system protein [Halarcobacter anaerophilus]